MDTPDQVAGLPESATTNYLTSFSHEARGQQYRLGIKPPTKARTPAGRTLSNFAISNLSNNDTVGSISGFLSVEKGQKVIDIESIGNDTAFVDNPSYKPNFLHVEDRTPRNSRYISGLVPAAVKQMLEAGIVDVWYSSNIRDIPPYDPDGDDMDAELNAWFVRTISDDAKHMYDVSLPALGLHVESVERLTQDATGRYINILSYKVTLPPKVSITVPEV